MKKYSLLKSILFIFVVVLILSFIFPIGSFTSSGYVSNGLNPIGVYDIFNIFLYTFANFLQFGLVFLAIGGFYGVINKTEVYSNLVERIVKKLKGKEILFIVSISICFSLFSAITGLPYILFIVVPFILAILLSLGFSKITAFMATVVSILVGQIGNLFGSDSVYSIMNFFSLNVTYELLGRIILLILVTFILDVFIVKKSKKDLNDKQKEEIPLYEKSKGKKSFVPLIIVFLLTFVLSIISMYHFDKIFGLKIFTNIYSNITNFEINGFSLFKNFIGSSVKAFGYFTVYDMIIILVIASLVIGLIYKIKFKEIIKSFYNGSKKMLSVAIIAIICNVIFMAMYRSSSVQNIYFTFVNYFLGMIKNTGLFGISIISALGSVFYNDFASFVNVISDPITMTITDTTVYPFISVVLQSIYNLFMIFVPTSVILMSGLAYLNISYKDWIKNSWKLILSLFLIILSVLIILMLFV